MILQLKDQSGSLLAVMDNATTKLGFFSPKDGYILHIIDTDPTSASANGWLEDTSKIAKYVMSDEDYNKRDNTYRKYKEDKLKEDPTWTLDKEIAARRGAPYEPTPPKPKVEDEDFQKEEAETIQIGSRCEVTSPEGGKRGVVKFVGKNCQGLPLGWWVGVQYDEPVGKNDGSVKGTRFFECPDRYGGFVRPNLVKTGEEYTPFDDDFEFSDEDEI
jgi:tubulin-folding cofactor B